MVRANLNKAQNFLKITTAAYKIRYVPKKEKSLCIWGLKGGNWDFNWFRFWVS
jgi:hypothetical protein